jgi:hypothetical protein
MLSDTIVISFFEKPAVNPDFLSHVLQKRNGIKIKVLLEKSYGLKHNSEKGNFYV